MTSITTSGWESIVTWLLLVSTVVAFTLELKERT